MEAGIEDDVDVILARTNIRKMITMLETDLYLRSTEGMRIACKIHDEFAHHIQHEVPVKNLPRSQAP